MVFNRGNASIIIISVLAILLVISATAAGYLYLQSQNQIPPVQYTPPPSAQPTVQPSPAQITVPTTQNETANWDSFTFKENLVSFKYPKNVVLSYFPTDNTGKMETDRMASGENAVLKKGTIKIMGINPNQIGIGGIPGSNYKQTTLTIDGYEVTKLTNTNGTFYTTIPYQGKVLMVSCFSEETLCDQILSTFKFIQ